MYRKARPKRNNLNGLKRVNLNRTILKNRQTKRASCFLMGSREKMFHANLSWRRAPRSGSVASLNLVSEADTVFVSFLFWAPTTTTMTSLSRAQTENVFLGSSYIGRHENNVDDVETSVRARNDEVQVTTGSVCLSLRSFFPIFLSFGFKSFGFK